MGLCVNWFSHALSVFVFSPLFILGCICIETIEVVEKEDSQIVKGILLMIGVDFWLKKGESCVSKGGELMGRCPTIFNVFDTRVYL